MVSWDPVPESGRNGIVREYRVEYSTEGNNSLLKRINVMGEELLGLQPFSNYTIKVAAKTVAYGNYSEPIFVTSGELGKEYFVSFSIITIETILSLRLSNPCAGDQTFTRAHAIIVLQSVHRNKIRNLRLKIQTQKLNRKDLACKLYIQGIILFVLENTIREMISSKMKSHWRTFGANCCDLISIRRF